MLGGFRVSCKLRNKVRAKSKKKVTKKKEAVNVLAKMCTHLIEKSPLLPYFDRFLKRSSPVLLQNVQLLLLLKSSIQLGNSKTISPTVADKGK